MMQLHGTPRSHFTRKLRILLAELGVPFELVLHDSVLARETEAYGNNPLLRIPTLVDGDTMLIESDHIARHIVRAHDPADRFGVTSENVEDMNRLAAINTVMGNEVVLILAKRGGIENLEAHAYFQKLWLATANGLAWLDARIAPDAPGFDYRDISLICMWDHLVQFKAIPELERYPRIAARVARHADRPTVPPTAPTPFA